MCQYIKTPAKRQMQTYGRYFEKGTPSQQIITVYVMFSQWESIAHFYCHDGLLNCYCLQGKWIHSDVAHWWKQDKKNNIYKNVDTLFVNVSTLKDMFTVQQCGEINSKKYEYRKKYIKLDFLWGSCKST